MVLSRTYNTGIMYKAEDTWGTPVTVDTVIKGKVTSFSSDWANNFFRIQGLGEGRNQTFTGWGGFDVGGSVEGIVGEPDFFVHGIGTKSGDGGSGTEYKLTESDTLTSFTMQCGTEAGGTDEVDTFAGCLLNNITFTATEGDLLRFSADWVGKTVATNTAIVAYSADTTALWNFAQGALLWGASPSEVLKVSSASITISNNLNIYRSLGSRFIEMPEPGQRRYDWTATVKAHTEMLTTLKQDLMGQADSPHEGITSASPTASLELHLYFEGPTNKKLWIQLDEASVESMSKPVDVGNGFVELTFSGIAEEGEDNVPLKWQNSA